MRTEFKVGAIPYSALRNGMWRGGGTRNTRAFDTQPAMEWIVEASRWQERHGTTARALLGVPSSFP